VSTLARVYGDSVCRASIKDTPDDFRVIEELDIDFSGAGEHLWLLIQKIELNTNDVVTTLAERFTVKPADVGYSGMKDKQAVTEQWFSICTPEHMDVGELTSSIKIKSVQRHHRKLRHGTHHGNRFHIVLNNIEWSNGAGQSEFESRIEKIGEQGFPNYLGPQRFGFNGQNIHRAKAWFAQPKKRISRQQRSLYLSAARSAIFNAVCDARIKANNWNACLSGEPLVLDGSRSFFVPENVDEEVLSRYQAKDVHPSGPWWGKGDPLAQGDCAEFEAAIVAQSQWSELCSGLASNRLDQERRALRAMPRQLTSEWLSDTRCALEFSLRPGVFATMLLHEIVDDIV